MIRTKHCLPTTNSKIIANYRTSTKWLLNSWPLSTKSVKHQWNRFSAICKKNTDQFLSTKSIVVQTQWTLLSERCAQCVEFLQTWKNNNTISFVFVCKTGWNYLFLDIVIVVTATGKQLWTELNNKRIISPK